MGRIELEEALVEAGFPPVLTAREAEATIAANLPPIDHHGEIVKSVGDDAPVMRLPFRPDFMGTELWQDGSGAGYSGPIVMGLADTAMYCCLIAALGTGVIPVMANYSITFLRPALAADLIAHPHRPPWRATALSGMPG